MTGHNYKKKRPPDRERGANEEERVIMREGEDGSSSSAVSEEDRNSDQDRSMAGGSIRKRIDSALHSAKFQLSLVSLITVHCSTSLLGLLLSLGLFHLDVDLTRLLASSFDCLLALFLSLFIVEMIVKVSVWRLRFFKHRLELFDAVVILLTLSLILVHMGRRMTIDGVGLLIVLRLWRISKIFNNMVTSMKLEMEKRVLKERRNRRALEREVSKLREYCLQQECELQMYRSMLQQNNIPQPMVLRLPTSPCTLRVIAEVNDAGDDDEEYRQNYEDSAPPEYSESPLGTNVHSDIDRASSV